MVVVVVATVMVVLILVVGVVAVLAAVVVPVMPVTMMKYRSRESVEIGWQCFLPQHVLSHLATTLRVVKAAVSKQIVFRCALNYRFERHCRTH